MRRERIPRGGFTLLELLMVVIIIAILASIALPQYLRTAERARASEALTTLGAVRSAELRQKALNDPTAGGAGTYVCVDELDIDVPGTTGNPTTGFWKYENLAATGSCTTNVGQAIRLGGPQVGKIICIDYDTGATGTDDPTYGLKVVTDATKCS